MDYNPPLNDFEAYQQKEEQFWGTARMFHTMLGFVDIPDAFDMTPLNDTGVMLDEVADTYSEVKKLAPDNKTFQQFLDELEEFNIFIYEDGLTLHITNERPNVDRPQVDKK